MVALAERQSEGKTIIVGKIVRCLTTRHHVSFSRVKMSKVHQDNFDSFDDSIGGRMRVFLVIFLLACAGAVYFYFADKHKDNTVGAAKPQADAQLMSASSEHSSALPDFASFTNANAKEKAFISYLEPLISANNKQILSDRERLK